jgi:hypothetical protein
VILLVLLLQAGEVESANNLYVLNFKTP